MTLYQFALFSPMIGVLARFFHIIFYSASGHCFSILISIGGVVTIARAFSVSYMRFLYAYVVSVLLCLGTIAASVA